MIPAASAEAALSLKPRHALLFKSAPGLDYF
jgi:hypothetical protein